MNTTTTFIDPESGNEYALGKFYILSDSGLSYGDGFSTEAEARAWCEQQNADPAALYHDSKNPNTYGRVRWPAEVPSVPEYTMNIWFADELRQMWLDYSPTEYAEAQRLGEAGISGFAGN